MTKPKTLEQLRAEKERAETQLAQEQHKLNRLENRKKYLEKGERQKRTHRLCNLGGTIESLAPEVKDLTRTEMTELMEYIFSLSEVQRAVISQKESTESCTIYASDALGLIQNDPRYAKVIQSDADLKNIPQKHLEHKLLTASATVSGKNVNMTEDNGSANAEAPLTVVNTRGFDLPTTGDNGTMMFTIVGILLMVGAAVVLYAVSSKKSA